MSPTVSFKSRWPATALMASTSENSALIWRFNSSSSGVTTWLYQALVNWKTARKIITAFIVEFELRKIQNESLAVFMSFSAYVICLFVFWIFKWVDDKCIKGRPFHRHTAAFFISEWKIYCCQLLYGTLYVNLYGVLKWIQRSIWRFIILLISHHISSYLLQMFCMLSLL